MESSERFVRRKEELRRVLEGTSWGGRMSALALAVTATSSKIPFQNRYLMPSEYAGAKSPPRIRT